MSENIKGKKGAALKIAAAVVIVLLAFLAVFLLYDSPAKYVKDSTGKVHILSDGSPHIYYTDLFGNTFYAKENGGRDYCAVPALVVENVAG